MSGAPIPQSEAELLQRVPPSNRPGVFPVDVLPPGEKIYYETRPGLFALYWGRVIALSLYLLLFLGATVFAPPDAAVGGLIFAAPGIAALAVVIMQWRHRIYALTDQRVIRISGARGSEFLDAAYVQVHNLTNYGSELRFDTTPPPSAVGAPPARVRVIRWEAIPDAPRVYTFVQEAFAFGLRRTRAAAILQSAVDKITATSMTCAYCGGLIDLATLDPANPRCPRCSAPFTLPT